MTKQIIHAHIFLEDGAYTVDCGDIPIVTQGATLDEAVHNLQEAVALFLQDEADRTAFALSPTPTVLVNYEIPSEYVKT